MILRDSVVRQERGNVTEVKFPFSTKWRRARDEEEKG
jgi:hypothetical protein